MKFLIKYATRGRRKWFMKTMTNILNTIDGSDFLILVTADDDDAAMNCIQIRSFIAECRNTRVVWGRSDSKVHAINRDMPTDYMWDILICMSDDMHWIKRDWNKHIAARARDVWGDSLDWFAHFNDGFVKDALPTMSIMGRTYYERDNYIYHPSYKSFSCDAEAMYVAQMRQRYCYFSEVLFLHQHPTHAPTPNDDTYRSNSLATPHDTANYWSRLNNYFYEPHGPGVPIPFKQYIGKQYG